VWEEAPGPGAALLLARSTAQAAPRRREREKIINQLRGKEKGKKKSPSHWRV
jgi:hypothetical protein